MKTFFKFLAAFTLATASLEIGVVQADDKPAVNTEPRISLVPFSPGGQTPEVDKSEEGRKAMNDPQQIEAGKQLFSAMNCNGCHFNGGGGIGPPLMDSVWIYGDSIENIAASIREGRPNGMPSFRGLLPEEQVWQVAAYVRSLSQPPPSSPSSAQQGK
jgi:cytochrome c oxidase cbb3-type subunit III